MVQVPPNVEVGAKHKGNEAAAYLEGIVNSMAQDGWEFFRVDQIGVNVRPGCIAGLLGQKDSYSIYYVITFRKSST
jgi:hypothetical protein